MTPDDQHKLMAKGARLLAVALNRVADRLDDDGLPDAERDDLADRVRMFVRTERGIPEPDAKGFGRVVILNLSAWIEQSRSKEGQTAEWLRDRCTEVLDRFGAVPLAEYQRVIDGTKTHKSRKPTLTPDAGAEELAKAARVHATLAAARNLRNQSKP